MATHNEKDDIGSWNAWITMCCSPHWSSRGTLPVKQVNTDKIVWLHSLTSAFTRTMLVTPCVLSGIQPSTVKGFYFFCWWQFFTFEEVPSLQGRRKHF